eukprot:764240-Hanusia_phi.AAC.7
MFAAGMLELPTSCPYTEPSMSLRSNPKVMSTWSRMPILEFILKMPDDENQLKTVTQSQLPSMRGTASGWAR